MRKMNVLKRVALISSGLEWKPMSKQDIIEYIWDKIEESFCEATIEKDLRYLREEFEAPIVFDYYTRCYRMEPGWKFSEAIIEYIRPC